MTNWILVVDEIGDLVFFKLRNVPGFLSLTVRKQLLDFDCQAWFEGHNYHFSYINLTAFDIPLHSPSEWAKKISSYIISEKELYEEIDEWVERRKEVTT